MSESNGSPPAPAPETSLAGTAFVQVVNQRYPSLVRWVEAYREQLVEAAQAASADGAAAPLALLFSRSEEELRWLTEVHVAILTDCIVRTRDAVVSALSPDEKWQIITAALDRAVTNALIVGAWAGHLGLVEFPGVEKLS